MESNPAIGSRQPDFKGMRIPGTVVVEQHRSGVCRFELVADFPPLSQAALDDAESRARLPRPQGRPQKMLSLQRA